MSIPKPTQTIAVVDHGSGNLRNITKALEFVVAHAADPRVREARILLTDDPALISAADKVVLPGVGAFEDCLQGMHTRGQFAPVQALARRGIPLLGICVGMQLLFEVGEEMGEHIGLGLIPGRVIKFRWADEPPPAQGRPLPVPHIGWNQVCGTRPHPLLADVKPGGYAYFVHSFHAADLDPAHILATTDYGYDFPSVVGRDNVWGIQFHPEKSQETGLRMLENFLQYGFLEETFGSLPDCAERPKQGDSDMRDVLR